MMNLIKPVNLATRKKIAQFCASVKHESAYAQYIRNYGEKVLTDTDFQIHEFMYDLRKQIRENRSMAIEIMGKGPFNFFKSIAI